MTRFRTHPSKRAGPLAAILVASLMAVVPVPVAMARAHAAAPQTTEHCVWISLPGHSDTKSHTYADGDTVTVHSQLYEYEDTLTGDPCGELESSTSISDNGHGAALYGQGMNELVFLQSNGTYSAVGEVVDGYSDAISLQPIAETTSCAAPGGGFTPSDGEPAITTGAANYCP
jgi:hypothetical protein